VFVYLMQADPDLSRVLEFDSEFLVGIGFAWINLAFIIFILSWLLYQPVLDFLMSRKNRIENDIDSARKNLQESEEAKALYVSRLANIESERSQILDAARRDANANRDEIIAQAKGDANDERARATREIEQQWVSANDTIKTQIIEVSSMMAGRFIESYIEPAEKEKLLNQAIADLGDAAWKG